MTPTELRDLVAALGTFKRWMEDRPLQLGLDEALITVILAAAAEGEELLKELAQ